MRLITRFTTADEFVTAFRKFCTKTTCFIPGAQAKRIGAETKFSIRLADGTPMLSGLCVVRDSWATGENPYERPGVRLGIRSLTTESKPVFHRLLLAAAKPDLDKSTRPTVKMEMLFRQEEREPSDEILPANPLTEMTDESLGAFVDCRLFEDAIPDSINEETRRNVVTQRIETEAAPKGTLLERALAASSVRRLDAPLARARAHARAEEHADSGFGPMLAQAADRIRPIADHTVPTRLPSQRKTMVGIPPPVLVVRPPALPRG